MVPIVRIQNMVNRLNLYLGSQSIYVVGFEFSTMGILCSKTQLCTRFYEPFSFFPKVIPLSLGLVSCFSLSSLQNCQSPLSHSFLLFIA